MSKQNLKIDKLISFILKKPSYIGWFIFTLLLFALSIIIVLKKKNLQDERQREINKIVKQLEGKLEETIDYARFSSLTIAMCIDDEGVPQNFDSISHNLINENNLIDVLELVPKGVVKYIYPLKGNESAMNYNILDNPLSRKEAINSIKLNRMYFAGPLKLKQGGEAIIGRMPVYKDNEFWGFSAVLIKLTTLLNNIGFFEFKDSPYIIQFSKVNPNTNKEEFFLDSQLNVDYKKYSPYFLKDGDWMLYVIPKDRRNLWLVMLPFLILGLIFIIIFSLLIVTLLKKIEKRRKKINEELLDSNLKFKTLAQNAPVGVFFTNSSGEFVFTNQKWKEYFGNDKYINLEDFFDKKLNLNDIDSIRQKWKQKFNNKGLFSYDLKLKDISGNVKWMNFSVSPLLDSNIKLKGFVGTVIDNTENKINELKFSKAIIETQETERQKIGGELHDNVNQILAASLLMTNAYLQDKTSEDLLIKAKNYTKMAIEEVRNLSHELSPTSFVNESFKETLMKLLNSVSDKFKVKLDIEDFDYSEVEPNIKLTLYRVLQEQLNNIIKHSQATELTVKLYTENRVICMQTFDNGIGFDVHENFNGFGLNNMIKRVELVHGSFNVKSSKGEGTLIQLNIPLNYSEQIAEIH